MLQTVQAVDATEYEERAIAETPFNEAPVYESPEEPLREPSISEARGGFSGSWELQTPFISPEANGGRRSRFCSVRRGRETLAELARAS